MPTALVVNPNTTESMTRDIAASAGKVFEPPWNFVATQPPGGPESIESWFEMNLAATALLRVIKENENVDGVVLACFGDPGLFAFREILPVPIVGIAEASFLTACTLGFKFGILVGDPKDVPAVENLLWSYGLEKRYAGSWPMEMAVLEMHRDREQSMRRLAMGADLLVKKGAEVILLGCAGLSSFQASLREDLELPVIDPVEAACWQLKALVEMGLNTSRTGMFARLGPKQFSSLDSFLEPDLAQWLAGRASEGFN